MIKSMIERQSEQCVRDFEAMFPPIPSRGNMLGFFNRHCKKYTPPNITKPFMKDVLVGKKKLLSKSDVKKADESLLHIIDHEILWRKVLNDRNLNKYFPDSSKGYWPDKSYLLNVVNTLKPEVFATAVSEASADNKGK